jgi:glycerophosphoryl diester phosphodiesterase
MPVMLLIAHRGYHAEVPENTLAAFDAAAALGVDGIETDIRLSADGLPVLIHDRVLPDGRYVASLTRDELQRELGHAVPTLDEALRRQRDILWLLEIKAPEATAATVDLVRRHLPTHRLLVISFWHTVAAEVARRVPVDCGVLVCHRPVDVGATHPAWSAQPGGVGAIVWNYEFVDAAAIDAARSRGLKNFVYGVGPPADHQQCRDWGVDGVITDYPRFVLQPPAAQQPVEKTS